MSFDNNEMLVNHIPENLLDAIDLYGKFFKEDEMYDTPAGGLVNDEIYHELVLRLNSLITMHTLLSTAKASGKAITKDIDINAVIDDVRIWIRELLHIYILVNLLKKQAPGKYMGPTLDMIRVCLQNIPAYTFTLDRDGSLLCMPCH